MFQKVQLREVHQWSNNLGNWDRNAGSLVHWARSRLQAGQACQTLPEIVKHNLKIESNFLSVIQNQVQRNTYIYLSNSVHLYSRMRRCLKPDIVNCLTSQWWENVLFGNQQRCSNHLISPPVWQSPRSFHILQKRRCCIVRQGGLGHGKRVSLPAWQQNLGQHTSLTEALRLSRVTVNPANRTSMHSASIGWGQIAAG